jgi:hypothetical protein
MKAIGRDILYFAEAGILIGRLTGFFAYSSIFVFAGYLALSTSIGEPVAAHDFPFVFGLIAFQFGVFALLKLWSLVKSTAKRRLHSFRHGFWLAIASAVFSSAAFANLFWPLGVWLGIVPTFCLLGHMLFLQSQLHAAQQGLQPDGSAFGGLKGFKVCPPYGKGTKGFAAQFGPLLVLTLAAAPTSYTLAAPDCLTGFVERESHPDDHVCVTPDSKARAQAENAVAQLSWTPGPFGPKTCANGLVWREAFQGDFTCVPPSIRTFVSQENSLGPSRRTP